MNRNTIYPCLGRQGQKMGQRAGEKELQQYSCTECIWSNCNIRGAIHQGRGSAKGQS